ncbi:TPA: DNA-binding response regulator [Clostridium perfringens]|uniref:DNA-binding response regulator n=2 Tax=Clostridium perfringens TaxID=1502 RepID=UPI0013E29934|nr:DNA-binding response regulator [Clostridium perfringens]MDU2325893.1 DNA-binding response regulator [Clostridium perfringens]MDU5649549.1 DNA-binding response regulator [Clostridium perfringens]MEA5269123.1 DNA-binding response regulator [Clostridium perfringens]MEA5272065.1 DNA-binding response regulator [Clostridium perfringens]MEA5312139.1 DNA-binding response regulator [Clostridium perfringens]
MEQALKINKVSYIDNIHRNSKGWITRSVIDKNGYKQWHYKYTELIGLDITGENIYITPNTFYKPYRRIECVKELNCLFIDLDYYKTGKTKDQVLMDLEENYFNQNIPIPNYVIDSGRGMYLMWRINAVPSKALPLWKAVQEYLWEQLKVFGADRQALDATRILRVPGSKNSKSKTIVSILDEYGYVYDLREIQNNFLPELKPYEKKKGRPKKINFIYRERSLYYARIQDIIKLCELRKYDLKGHRELILFLYRYYLCSFTEDIKKALNDVLELNSMFKHPLGEKEAIRATTSAERCYLDKEKQYKYKNNTIINLLDISEEEQIHMITIISNKEYKRRENIRGKKNYQERLRNQGKLTKKEELDISREKIKALREKGFKNKEISLMLELPIKTLERHITYMKKNGLL